MHKHTFLTLTIVFLLLSNINAQEIDKKKPLWAIPIDFSWTALDGATSATGLNVGFQIGSHILIRTRNKLILFVKA